MLLLQTVGPRSRWGWEDTKVRDLLDSLFVGFATRDLIDAKALLDDLA